MTEDQRLRFLIKKKISRLGKYSTVSDGDITTEKFLRKSGETILTLEKGELRTETENNSSGRVITKTWQGKVMTTFSVTTPEKSIMVLLDKKGSFVHKIITLDDNEAPECWYYNGKAVVPITTTECVSLIPGFD